MIMALDIATVYLVLCVFFKFTACRFELYSSREVSGDNSNRIMRQVELTPGGHSDTVQATSHSASNWTQHCFQNEYGPNCVYCVPHNTCLDGHYTCDVTTGSKQCLPGYKGDLCQVPDFQDINRFHVPCPQNECRNGGSCVSGYCCCIQGFTGILCEIEIIECNNESCLNDGICKDLIGSYRCICKPGYKGERCKEIESAHALTTPSRDSNCQSKLCRNNGTCYEDAFQTYCICPTYYTGVYCEKPLTETSSKKHNCSDNFFGIDCSKFCIPQNDCLGHFVCDPSSGNKICMSGWHGNNCDTRSLPQNVDPECPAHAGCKNDGQCFEQGCCCRHHFSGEYCNVESIGCISSPCQHAGTCVNQGKDFNCLCSSNYTGSNCEYRVNPEWIYDSTKYSPALPPSRSNVITDIKQTTINILLPTPTIALSLSTPPVFKLSTQALTQPSESMSLSKLSHYLATPGLSFPTSLLEPTHIAGFSIKDTIDIQSSFLILSSTLVNQHTNPTSKERNTIPQTPQLTYFASFPHITESYFSLSNKSIDLSLVAASKSSRMFLSESQIEIKESQFAITSSPDNRHFISFSHSTRVSNSVTFSNNFVGSILPLNISSITLSISPGTTRIIHSHSNTVFSPSHHFNEPQVTYNIILSADINTASLINSEAIVTSTTGPFNLVSRTYEPNKSLSPLHQSSAIHPSNTIHHSNTIQQSNLLLSSSPQAYTDQTADDTSSTIFLFSPSYHSKYHSIIGTTSIFYQTSDSETSVSYKKHDLSLSLESYKDKSLSTDTMTTTTTHASSSYSSPISMYQIPMSSETSHKEQLTSFMLQSSFSNDISSVLLTQRTSYVGLDPTLSSSYMKRDSLTPHPQLLLSGELEPSNSPFTSKSLFNNQFVSTRFTPYLSSYRHTSAFEMSTLMSGLPFADFNRSTKTPSPTMNFSSLIVNTKQTADQARESSDRLSQVMSTSEPSVYPTPVPTTAFSHTLPGYHLNSVKYADSSHSVVPMSKFLLSPDSSNVTKLHIEPITKSSGLVIPTQSTIGEMLVSGSVQSTQINFGKFPASVTVNIVPTSSGYVHGSVITEETRPVKESTSGISEAWTIALITIGCIAFLMLIIAVIVIVSIVQRRKDSREIQQSPTDIHDFSKEHFSVQPEFHNPVYDEIGETEVDSDDDSVKYDMYVVNE